MGDIVDRMDLQADIERAEEVAAVVGAYWKRLRRITNTGDETIMPMAMHFQSALLFGVTEYVTDEPDIEMGDEFSE